MLAGLAGGSVAKTFLTVETRPAAYGMGDNNLEGQSQPAARMRRTTYRDTAVDEQHTQGWGGTGPRRWHKNKGGGTGVRLEG